MMYNVHDDPLRCTSVICIFVGFRLMFWSRHDTVPDKAVISFISYQSISKLYCSNYCTASTIYKAIRKLKFARCNLKLGLKLIYIYNIYYNICTYLCSVNITILMRWWWVCDVYWLGVRKG